jgi:glycosyltransferase involved in cell wall biosynthesis
MIYTKLGGIMLIGITRIRNEEDILKDTLDHWSKLCDGGIFVYDDCSTDRTVEICKNHPAVKGIVQGKTWDNNRAKAEFQNRQSILVEALKIAKDSDWIVYFDADEFLYNFDKKILTDNIDGIRCRLFDVYITLEDSHEMYHKRNYVGPEYRDILFFFRVPCIDSYKFLDQRECSLKPNSRLIQAGFIKHFGKGFSVQQWEATCDYYSKYFPMYAEKWMKRKGKAIHKLSDFGAKLIKFSDILNGKESGFLLK